MTSKKKTALIFLASINLMNLAAGVISQLTMAFGWDVTSIIPVKGELSVYQILLMNFSVVVVIMSAIHLITTYLSTDVPYSLGEIITNCPGISLTVPVILLLVGIYNAIFSASTGVDRFLIILCSVIYVLLNAVNFGCLSTIKEDAE